MLAFLLSTGTNPTVVPFQVQEFSAGGWILLFLAVTVGSAILSFALGFNRRTNGGKGLMSKSGLLIAGVTSLACAIFGMPLISTVATESPKASYMQAWVADNYDLTVSYEDALALYGQNNVVTATDADGENIDVMLMSPDGLWHDGNAALLVDPETKIPLGWDSNPLLDARNNPQPSPAPSETVDPSASPEPSSSESPSAAPEVESAEVKRASTFDVCAATVRTDDSLSFSSETIEANCAEMVEKVEQDLAGKSVEELDALLVDCREELVPLLARGGDAPDVLRVTCMTIDHVLAAERQSVGTGNFGDDA